MTVKELRDFLKDAPDDFEVEIWDYDQQDWRRNLYNVFQIVKTVKDGQ